MSKKAIVFALALMTGTASADENIKLNDQYKVLNKSSRVSIHVTEFTPKGNPDYICAYVAGVNNWGAHGGLSCFPKPEVKRRESDQ